ncbi:MAG: translation elongation factor Ts [Alphaproteobacteria bacterium]|nr:translation elongation factor Ts [Alphaproteobacteria bacterium]
MADITAQRVKDLRDTTSAGMMDCKKALVEANGDMEAAIDWLRKKGLSAAAKKSGRVAAEGLVAVAVSGTKAVALEVNAETDFVARNDAFQTFATNAVKVALESGASDIEALKTKEYPATGRNVQEELTQIIATIGENMNLRRMVNLNITNGVIASYVHNAIAPNLGKIGVLVALESTADAGKLMDLGKQIAMHVAAARPEALTIADVDTKALDRERNVLADQARASGKPEDIIAKMVDGRLRKYYEEVVLMEQVYVVDGESKIKDVVANAAKTLGAEVKLTGFVRYQLGEGIEKAESDFASEVASMAG